MSAFNLPPGVTARDIEGDTSKRLFTVEIVVRVTVPARDDDGAIEDAENELALPSNARILRSEVTDTEPL